MTITLSVHSLIGMAYMAGVACGALIMGVFVAWLHRWP